MAEIIVTIPDENIPELKLAVQYANQGAIMENQEVIAYLENIFQSDLRSISNRYQRSLHEQLYDFVDPLA